MGHEGDRRTSAELRRGPEGLVPSARELAGLLRGIRGGDLDALRRFYDATGALVFGMVCTALQDQDQDRAAEATERCFLWVWRTAPSVDPAHPCALTFLLRAVRRELADPPPGP